MQLSITIAEVEAHPSRKARMSRKNGKYFEPNSLLSVQPTDRPELSAELQEHGEGSTRPAETRCKNTTASYESGRTLALTLHKVHRENGVRGRRQQTPPYSQTQSTKKIKPTPVHRAYSVHFFLKF